MEIVKIRFFVNLTFLLAKKSGDSSVGYASLRMTALVRAFCEFYDSTRSKGGGFFASAQNDGFALILLFFF